MPLKINKFEQNEFHLHDNNENFDHWKCRGHQNYAFRNCFCYVLNKLGKFHDMFPCDFLRK